MYLAEALAERAEAQARIHELKERLRQTARIQEGDEPAEDPQALLKEIEAIYQRHRQLVRAINATNAATEFDGATLADALIERDNLLQRRRFYTELAAASSTRQDRYSRNELRYISVLDVKELHAKADQLSRDFRKLDTRIQQKNWLTEVQGL
ncbi:DIP1984 family protein [Corynebacterium sp.]|uniref:DIP1984 family protein n=1 Tax=Corynebacterium sp. TaxID=1720 RepID=UPI0026DDA0C3|nr:DIP1984 family protein [Corynebacterium sp.]MDO5032245.1 DIP1984 family protein [Corynebacterium sp.]